jgi:hypothetical protein
MALTVLLTTACKSNPSAATQSNEPAVKATAHAENGGGQVRPTQAVTNTLNSGDKLLANQSVTLHSIRGLTSLIFQHCPLFHCRFIALKSRTFVVKSRTTFAIKFVRYLNAKSTPMGDCGRGCLGRGAPQGICDPSLGRASVSPRAQHAERLVLCGVRSHPLCPRFEYKQALDSAI